MDKTYPVGWFFAILIQSDARTAIDLIKTSGTIPFHASFRPSERCIVLNRRTETGWEEETELSFETTADASVSISIVAISSTIVVQIQDFTFVWEKMTRADLMVAQGVCASPDSIARPIYTLAPSLLADLSAAAAHTRPALGGSVVGAPMVGRVEDTDGCLSVSGWACRASGQRPKIAVETIQGPLDCTVRPVFRSDLFTNFEDNDFGFEIDLPGVIWRLADDDGTVTLKVTADGRPLSPGRIVLRASECLPRLMEICLGEPELPEFSRYALLCLEHLATRAFQDLMTAEDRRSAWRLAKALNWTPVPPEWFPTEIAEAAGPEHADAGDAQSDARHDDKLRSTVNSSDKQFAVNGVGLSADRISANVLPSISVIICTHNRYEFLTGAITSIELQDSVPDNMELIIVDNSSSPAEQEAYRNALDIHCRYQYVIERVPGLSRARNIGVRRARGQIVAFMDDDARASPQWVSRIAEVFADKTVGVAGGPVRPLWPTSRPAWLHPWLEGFLTIVDRGTEFRTLAESEWLAGTNIAFRRDLIIAAGMFNEKLGRMGRLLLSNEELAVTTMIRASGFSVVYDPKMEMRHRVHEDRISQSWMRRRVFWQMVSDMFSQEQEQGGADFVRNADNIMDYMAKLSPKERGLGGLFLDVEEPELFQKQMEALSALVRIMAVDGRDWRSYLTGEPA